MLSSRAANVSTAVAHLSTNVARSAPPILVLGGGIAGLSCAYYLSKLPNSLLQGRKVLVIESQSTPGGWLQSENFSDGVVHELGPRSIRTAGLVGLNTLNLIEELGLEPDAIAIPASSPAAKKRLIYANKQMYQLPGSLLQTIRVQPPFTKPIITSLIGELFKPKFQQEPDADISVFDFVDQRLGHEAAKYISDPMVRGIVAGDCRKISFRSLFPDVYRKSVAHGSLVKGMLLGKALPLPQGLDINEGQLAKRAAKEKWIAWSLKQGVGHFPRKLLQKLDTCENVEVLTSASVTKIEFNHKKALVSIATKSGELLEFETPDIFSCLPAQRLSKCFSPMNGHLKSTVNKIKSVDVALAYFQFQEKDVLKPDAGFGFLTPSFEDSPVLGATFDSCCFPQHDAGQNITSVTCMMGGEWFPQRFKNVGEKEMLDQAEDTARRILGFRSPLTRSSFRVHRSCIPQYHLNHHQVVRDIRKQIDSLCDNFQLLGASYEGVSVNDVIFNTRKSVHAFAQNMK